MPAWPSRIAAGWSVYSRHAEARRRICRPTRYRPVRSTQPAHPRRAGQSRGHALPFGNVRPGHGTTRRYPALAVPGVANSQTPQSSLLSLQGREEHVPETLQFVVALPSPKTREIFTQQRFERQSPESLDCPVITGTAFFVPQIALPPSPRVLQFFLEEMHHVE